MYLLVQVGWEAPWIRTWINAVTATVKDASIRMQLRVWFTHANMQLDLVHGRPYVGASAVHFRLGLGSG